MRKTTAKIILCLFGLGFIILSVLLIYWMPLYFGFLYGAIICSLLVSFSFVEVFGVRNKIPSNYKKPSNFKVTAKVINEIKKAVNSNELNKRPNTSSTWECFSKEDKNN
jgi:uncharacterized protein (DUF58 family)